MRINLLPWREWEQRRRRQHFVLVLVLAFVAGIAIVYWTSHMVGAAVDDQQARNTYLRRQVAVLNRKISEIKTLKQTRADLLSRMRVIERLEQSRPMVVHLFDELATTVPSGVYLTSIENRDGRLKIAGVADSPAGVSTYMRNIAASPWLAPPNLQIVRTAGSGSERRSSFGVSSELVTPDEKKNVGGGAGGGR
ncbi:MAG: PilN domain-containing protein [Gammaproteobacteria bacterium]